MQKKRRTHTNNRPHDAGSLLPTQQALHSISVIAGKKLARVRFSLAKMSPKLMIGLLLLALAQQKVAQCQSTNNLFFLTSANQRQTQSNNLGSQNNVVFPNHLHTSQGHSSRQSAPAASIYVNPNPSTRSTKFGKEPAPNKQQNGPQPRWFPLGPQKAATSGASAETVGSTPSSIGRIEQHQVADWPFFKSLQVARNAQLFNQLAPPRPTPAQQQQKPPTAAPDNGVELIDKSQAIESMRVMKSNPDEDGTADSADKSEGESTSGSTPSIQVESATEAPGTSSPLGQAQATRAPTTTSTTTSTTTTTTTTPTTTTTTTPTTTPAPTPIKPTEGDKRAPLSGAEPRPGVRGQGAGKEVLAPNFHSSVQQAVNRLVEMGAKVLEKGDGNDRMPGEPQKQEGRLENGAVRASNGNPRSSLSLNVLLKNFGAFNLSSLDQILLKSSLKDRNSDSHRADASAENLSEPLPLAHQAIRIIGGHELANEKEDGDGDPKGISSMMEQVKNSMQQGSAECKIQYTMKNVNISLVNGAKSDYTCDYIIDRKLGRTGWPANDSGKLEGRKVCKLLLKSGFFSNQSETVEGPSVCSNQTHLAIGGTNFCQAEAEAATLERTFNFPLDREAFDIRLVHKSRSAHEAHGEEQDESSKDEIHLEIKPIVDSDCPIGSTTTGANQPSVEYESPSGGSIEVPDELAHKEANPPAKMRSTGINATPKPSLSADNESRAGGQLGARALNLPLKANKMQPSRSKPTVSKPTGTISAEDENTRLASGKPARVTNSDSEKTASPSTNQIFELNDKGNTKKSNWPLGIDEQQSNEALPLCSNQATSVHVSTIGQLLTPEYPNNYPANLRCRMIIRRVSLAYCKLLLHFRDFDLVNGNQREGNSTTGECTSDYLQIGSTRYCNRYAMIGHKMVLDFADAGTAMDSDHRVATAAAAAGQAEGEALESVELMFNSDRSLSGRGFLIKYQQMLCHQQQEQLVQPPHRDARLPTKEEDQETTSGPPLRTLAPPMQQPDFGFALRTTFGAPPSAASQPGGTTLAPQKKSSKKTTKLGGLHEKQASISAPEQPAVSAAAHKGDHKRRVEGERGANITVSGSLQLQMASTASSGLLIDPLANSADLNTDYGQPLADLEQNSQQRRRSSQKQEVQAVDIEPKKSGQLVQCNQVNHEMSFLLKSHNYPDEYGNNLQCMYYVRRNNSRVCYLELTFVQFDLEADTDCRFDYLEINNVRLCGSLKDFGPTKTTRIYLFEEPLKLISFRSDSIGTKSGFLIKADQLECAANGSILRASNLPSIVSASQDQNGSSRQLATGARHSQQNSSSVFQYDSPLIKTSGGAAEQPASPGTSATQQAAGSSRNPPIASQVAFLSGKLRSGQCDQLLYGTETTIKSPLWPESYANDPTIGQCKYTILRQASARQLNSKSICQFELRFVHLRLGPNDCLEIDSHELLCGFSARNLIKYYPLTERQTHATITFTMGPPLGQRRQPGANSSSPDLRLPLRFMVIVRQLECIDGFLVPPQADSLPRAPAEALPAANATSLLYASGQPAAAPHYANRTSARAQQQVASGSGGSAPKLNYDSQPRTLDKARSSSGVLMYSFASSLSSGGQQAAAGADSLSGAAKSTASSAGGQQQQIHSAPSKQPCLLHYAQFNGILAASNLLARSESIAGHKPGDECEIRIKLLPAFCQLQLTFGEFDLQPERTLNGSCLGDYIELAGLQYCGGELKNSTRTLSTSLPGQRHISLRLSLTSSHAFRAIYKQLECAPQPLGELPAAGENSQAPERQQSRERPGFASSATSGAGAATKIDFREIAIRGEHFQLDSAELEADRLKQSYAANLFIIYKIKRFRPEACKLRLLFYKFDLEPAADGGCKRDFLDINNVDRLCGQIEGSSSELAREYNWPATSGDFQISFVSDSQLQGAGFHIFGQQVASCGERNETRDERNSTSTDEWPRGQQMVVFDEHQTVAGVHREPGAPVKRQRQQQPQPQKEEQKPEKSPMGASAPGKLDSANCSRIIETSDFQLTSPNWPQRYNSIGSCHYLIRRSSADVCSVTLSVNSLILDTSGRGDESGRQCDKSQIGDYLEIETEASAGQTMALCGFLTRPRTLTLPFTRPFLVLKFVANGNTGFGFLIEGKQNHLDCSGTHSTLEGQAGGAQTSTMAPAAGAGEQHVEADGQPANSCNRLLTDQFSLIESANFPNLYASNQDCLVAVRRPNESVCAIDIVLNHFDLEMGSPASGACDNDYIEIDYTRFCGNSYARNHKLRFNYFHSERDKLIRFHTNEAGAATGYSMQVIQVQSCDKPGEERAGPPEQSGPEKARADEQQARPQPEKAIPAVAPKSRQQDREVINYLASNSRRPDIAANGTALERTLCKFVYHGQRQLLLSPNYNQHKMNYDNNLDCLYKIVARGYEFCSLRLTILDLDLTGGNSREDSQAGECPNDYLLIDNKRYCGPMAPQGDTTTSGPSDKEAPKQSSLEIEFDSNLPREIDLLYHTDGHSNAGRGFKLLAEQVACEESKSNSHSEADQVEVAQARRAHQSHFGSLSYPKNYVTSPRDQRSRGRAKWELAPRVAAAKSTLAHNGQEPKANTDKEEIVTLHRGIVVNRISQVAAHTRN